MIEPRHLAHAPIKEALIDLKVALPQGATVETLDQHDFLATAGYTIRKAIRQGTLRVDGGNPKDSTVEHSLIGYRYESPDGSRVLQLRTNGFTFSKLQPYTTWEDLKAEAEAAWAIYRKIASPTRITRVATRYINVLRIPLAMKAFEDYLSAPPLIPDGLPQTVSSFLTRVVIPEPSIDATGIITQALEGHEGDELPVILDIDVFVNRQFDIDDPTYWDALEDLRIFKNRIFFHSITDTTAELFQ